jgi:hypothetical protein
MRAFDTLPGELNASIISSIITWSAHNAAEECWNSNVKGDAAETGL